VNQSLPPGFYLDGSTGWIYGTTYQAGSYTFTYNCMSQTGSYDQQQLMLQVN
jgi:hypothetical protein